MHHLRRLRRDPTDTSCPCAMQGGTHRPPETSRLTFPHEILPLQCLDRASTLMGAMHTAPVRRLLCVGSKWLREPRLRAPRLLRVWRRSRPPRLLLQTRHPFQRRPCLQITSFRRVSFSGTDTVMASFIRACLKDGSGGAAALTRMKNFQDTTSARWKCPYPTAWAPLVFCRRGSLSILTGQCVCRMLRLQHVAVFPRDDRVCSVTCQSPQGKCIRCHRVIVTSLRVMQVPGTSGVGKDLHTRTTPRFFALPRDKRQHLPWRWLTTPWKPTRVTGATAVDRMVRCEPSVRTCVPAHTHTHTHIHTHTEVILNVVARKLATVTEEG
eukprot:Opistho-2@13838